MKRIYFATRFTNAPVILNLAKNNSTFIAHARWLKHWKLGTEPTQRNAERYWPENFEDIDTADGIIVFAYDEDVLSGTLVEIGYALAKNKFVVLTCPDHPQVRCWKWYPNLFWAQNVEDAIQLITTR